MSSELSKRVITAVIGVAVILALVLPGGRPGAAIFAAVMSLAMLYEFGQIAFSLPDKLQKRNLMLGLSWLVSFTSFWIPRGEYELFILGFLTLCGYFLFTADRHAGPAFSTHYQELMYSVFGLLYLGFLPLYLPLIRDSAAGLHWTAIFLIIVWAGDSGAYFVGRRFGKRKLYSCISPKKTIEGAAGGLLCGLLLVFLYKFLFFKSLTVGTVVLISLVVGVAAILGDLAESFLKRAFNTKDSGSILPGHGGFLDRFDGVVFSLPVMYGCMRIFI